MEIRFGTQNVLMNVRFSILKLSNRKLKPV